MTTDAEKRAALVAQMMEDSDALFTTCPDQGSRMVTVFYQESKETGNVLFFMSIVCRHCESTTMCEAPLYQVDRVTLSDEEAFNRALDAATAKHKCSTCGRSVRPLYKDADVLFKRVDHIPGFLIGNHFV